MSLSTSMLKSSIKLLTAERCPPKSVQKWCFLGRMPTPRRQSSRGCDHTAPRDRSLDVLLPSCPTPPGIRHQMPATLPGRLVFPTVTFSHLLSYFISLESTLLRGNFGGSALTGQPFTPSHANGSKAERTTNVDQRTFQRDSEEMQQEIQHLRGSFTN